VKTLCNDSRISKHNKKPSGHSKLDYTLVSNKSSVLDLTERNNLFDVTLKNLSKITKKEDFVLNSEFHNSIFKPAEEDFMIEDKFDDHIKHNEFDNVVQATVTGQGGRYLVEEFYKVSL
jgi:hypothetical protein